MDDINEGMFLAFCDNQGLDPDSDDALDAYRDARAGR